MLDVLQCRIKSVRNISKILRSAICCLEVQKGEDISCILECLERQVIHELGAILVDMEVEIKKKKEGKTND